jgi:mRNA interferase MazF
MNPGDVVLVEMPQFGGGKLKLRPALLLALLPGPFQTALVCGISTLLKPLPANWDELVDSSDGDFVISGLHSSSVIRLSYLYAVTPQQIITQIGSIDPARLTRLRSRLSDHLRP